eukprot:CAMPEP_0197437638 /NCGR_PEP_ID=MMETSP1175-20131217/4841_1 /TAXON_ID=1003142 /ORGANISM="Triceratium dubium, Strain CCMP147" /LENGTH=362 /DNA_ID=CAMNT_0042967215 /DNA_START=204 /DNA_END=1288 /DNA_ORIENTATION=-
MTRATATATAGTSSQSQRAGQSKQRSRPRSLGPSASAGNSSEPQLSSSSRRGPRRGSVPHDAAAAAGGAGGPERGPASKELSSRSNVGHKGSAGGSNIGVGSGGEQHKSSSAITDGHGSRIMSEDGEVGIERTAAASFRSKRRSAGAGASGARRPSGSKRALQKQTSDISVSQIGQTDGANKTANQRHRERAFRAVSDRVKFQQRSRAASQAQQAKEKQEQQQQQQQQHQQRPQIVSTFSRAELGDSHDTQLLKGRASSVGSLADAATLSSSHASILQSSSVADSHQFQQQGNAGSLASVDLSRTTSGGGKSSALPSVDLSRNTSGGKGSNPNNNNISSMSSVASGTAISGFSQHSGGTHST